MSEVAKDKKGNVRKYDAKQVEEIKKRYSEGVHQGKLAREYGTSQPTISLIVRGLYKPREERA